MTPEISLQALILLALAALFGWWLRGRAGDAQCVTLIIDGEVIEVTPDVIGRANTLLFLASSGITAFNEDGSPTPNRLMLLRAAKDLGHQGPPGFSWDLAFEAHEGDDHYPKIVPMRRPGPVDASATDLT